MLARALLRPGGGVSADLPEPDVQKVVAKMTKIYLQEQLTNPGAKFVLPEDFEVRRTRRCARMGAGVAEADDAQALGYDGLAAGGR